MSATATVRPVRDATEIARADPVREAAGFGAVIVDEMHWIRAIGAGEVFLAEDDGVVVGAGAALHLGATGWIGGISVVPHARGRGLGGALTEASVDWLRDRGTTTVLLYATDLGRPVYERLGFVDDGSADVWVGQAPDPVPTRGVRPGRPGDVDAALEIDAAATGEDRSTIGRALWPTRAFVFEGGRGAAIGGRFGGGTVVAHDPEAGAALLPTSLAAQIGQIRAAAPTENAAAAETLRAAGFRRDFTTPRMRLGPAVPARPDRLFRLYNLFWG